MPVNFSEWKFFRDNIGLNETFNDLYTRYLRSLGLTGTLQDMIPKYKRNRVQLETEMRILASDDGSYLYTDDDNPVETY